MRGPVLLVALVALTASALVAACAKPLPPPPVDAGAVDAESAEDAASPDAAEAGKGSLIKLGATAQTSVLDAPWWPESGKGSKRLGYLRHGAVITAYDRPTVNDDCKEGWYEVETTGFVCGKAVSAELSNPRVRLAPKQPDQDAGLPYRYGVNLQDGTPLYRRVLGAEDRKKYEPWLVPAKPAPEEASGEGDKAEKTEASEGEESPRSDKADKADKADKKDAGPVDAGVDAAKPKLKSFKGRGVLVRTMARGFYLALDRSFNAGGARWWRTTFGFAVPFERIMLQPGVTKHVGSWFEAIVLDGPDAGDDAGDAGVGVAGTVAFVNHGFARKLEISEDQKKISRRRRAAQAQRGAPGRARRRRVGRDVSPHGRGLLRPHDGSERGASGVPRGSAPGREVDRRRPHAPDAHRVRRDAARSSPRSSPRAAATRRTRSATSRRPPGATASARST